MTSITTLQSMYFTQTSHMHNYFCCNKTLQLETESKLSVHYIFEQSTTFEFGILIAKRKGIQKFMQFIDIIYKRDVINLDICYEISNNVTHLNLVKFMYLYFI